MIITISLLVLKFFFLRLLVPPKMVRSFEDSYDVRIGSKWSFNCSATGAPQPTYEWYQNGSLVESK